MGRGGFGQSPALLEQLLRHDWPGEYGLEADRG
jgi:hypothetical protein